MYGDRRKPLIILLLGVLAAIVGVACLQLLPTPRVGPYGAIAMSDTKLAYGGAWGYSDPLSAYKRAISECNKASGGADCVVKVSLKNNCGALAISIKRNASFLVQGNNRTATTTTALAQCRDSGANDCAIRENICSSEF